MIRYVFSVTDSSTTMMLLLVSVLVLVYYWTTRRPGDIPPGPRMWLPLLGNLPSLAGKDIFEVLRSMRREFGDVFSLYTGYKLMVVVNGHAAIKEALVKYGHILNGRPKNPLITGALGETGIIFSSGPFWKEQRKFALSAIQQIAFTGSSFEDRILVEVENLLELIDSHGSTAFDIKRYVDPSVANVVFGIATGKRFRHDDDIFQAYIKALEENAELLATASVLVDSFPWLQYVPGDPFKTKTPIENAEKIKESLLKDVYEDHMETFDEGNIRDMVDLYILQIRKHDQTSGSSNFTYRQLLALIGDILGAGTETTSTTIRWCLLFLINNRDVQYRMRREITEVTGHHRLPSLSDRKHLPYVEAAISEVLRIAHVAPLALPHAVESEEDVFFHGYRIPKSASLLINIDSIFSDPKIFNNPRQFQPERFLDANGEVSKLEEFIPFGIGRRICVGELVAKAELFLFLTTLVQTYTFLPEVDGDMLDTEGVMSVTYRPKPFRMKAIRNG